MVNCAGLYYRCRSAAFIAPTDGYKERTTMRMLKGISCKRCDDCNNLLDLLREQVPEYGASIRPTIVNKGLYTLKIVEGDIDDDPEVGFVLVKEGELDFDNYEVELNRGRK